MSHNTLVPRQATPTFKVETLDDTAWRSDKHAEAFMIMIVFYRGLHCPVCSRYLASLENLMPEFRSRGVEVIAVSSDVRERAERARSDWKLETLQIGYGLRLETAREWGLFISAGKGKSSLGIEEPAEFSEPGLFLLKPDGTLYASSIQTMPFARPAFQDVLQAIDFIKKNDYPARGERM